MENLNIPIHHKDNKLMLTVSTKLYSPEVIATSLYNFSADFYVFQQPSETHEESVDVFFEAKDNATTVDDTLVKRFCNDLADQQIRFLTEKEFGHIRDLIVEEAFKPVTK
ncbi:MAG: His-Xaa-Ser system protein HxsD [Muribaculaceae bacterium]|nr:His-Xaa-Ser system protein HxsD [Muribaculaceae bacterium]